MRPRTSDLYELPFTPGTGFAKTPILLQTYTDASPGSYDDSWMASPSTPPALCTTQTHTTVSLPSRTLKQAAPIRRINTLCRHSGAKGMELDANGNVYGASVCHSGGDNPWLCAPDGSVTAQRSIRWRSGQHGFRHRCGQCVGLRNGRNSRVRIFQPRIRRDGWNHVLDDLGRRLSTATVSASSYPATITFTATKPNSQTATLTVADTTNGGEGTATVTGFALTTPQTLTFTAPTTTTSTYSPGETIVVR